MTIHIDGIFRLTRPLHVSAGAENVNGKNTNLTMTMPLVRQNGVDQLPYFPGNDLRGRIRRFAARMVMSHLASTGVKIPLSIFTGLMSGTASASPDTASLTVEEAMRARYHLFMGVFGGGARLLRSGFRVMDLIPILQVTISAGMVPARMGEISDTTFTPKIRSEGVTVSLKPWQLLHKYNFLKVDDVYRVTNTTDIEHNLEDATQEIMAYQQQTIANKMERRKSKEEGSKDAPTKTDVGNMMTVQAIAAGTPMYYAMEMSDHLSDAQIGLLIYALQELINEQALGGWVRSGLGKFTVDLTFTREGESFNLFNLEDREYVIAPQAAHYVEATKLALASIQLPELIEFYSPRKVKEAA